MAEVNLSAKNSKRKVPAPRVDLTPMVDLGFILITFFMYTTTLLEAKRMKVELPIPSPSKTEIPMESTLTFFLIKDHRIIYYEGVAETEADYKKTSMQELRTIIQHKQSAIRRLPASFSEQAHKLHVVIKPHASSKYDDLVSVLDEMLINDVPYYFILDISEEEEKVLASIR